MAASAGRDDEPITAINVTPLVDVCLVLVIIFMAVAPMAVTLGLKVLETRPSNAEGKASADENVSVSILPDGRLLINGAEADPLLLRLLLAKALSASKDKMVVVSAQAASPVGRVVEVLDESKQAGAQKLALMKAGG